MGRRRAFLIAAVVALVTGRAGSGPVAGVAAFAPAGSVERVEQIKVRFATPMVAFGDPRLPAPLAGTCSAGATGRWVDAQNYAVDLPAPLAGGRRCTYALVAGLKDAAGAAVRGPSRFTFDTGGPAIRAALPDDGGHGIEEDQIFLLALNAAPTPASVAEHASCAIDGVGEAVPLDILSDATRATIVAAATGDFRLRNFLQKAGVVAANPEWGEQPQPRSVVAAARCRRALPAGGRVAIVWGAGIATDGGLATLRARGLDFHVRPAFTVRFECSRANPAAACSPIEPLTVRFTGQVPAAAARGVRLVDPGNRALVPEPIKDHVQTVDAVTFKGPFAERSRFRVELPAGLVDDAGRRPVNAARFPLDVATDDAPPLVKFASGFGIVEAEAGSAGTGVLPVTVRAVEATLGGRATGPLGGRDVVVATDATVAKWLRTLDKAEERTQDAEPIAGSDDKTYIETTRSTPLLRGDAPARTFTIARREPRAFEVIGIPLHGRGFHVVELASPRLGAALLGRGGTRYVAAGALVTDMAVHFQWGRGRSLAWVTRLADAQPVGGARIAVSDSCTGALLARATTDASGRAYIGDVLPEPTGDGDCSYGQAPLMVSARAGDDYSFTLTTWSRGIGPSDFSLATGDAADRTAWQTIFDRTLLRAGETVHMKHVVRARTDAGATAGGGGGFGPAELPRDPTVVIRHLGSDQTYEVDTRLGRDGIGETTWTVPAAAALGEYVVEIGERGASERHAAGTFTVEEFRLPTIRARVEGPRSAQVAPTRIDLDLSLAYLAGGAANNAPVKLRTLVQPRILEIADYPKYAFSGEEIKAGIVRLDGSDDPGTPAPTRARVDPVTLGPNGTKRVTIDRLTPVTVPSTLVAEMDYDDANGEVATAKGSVSLDPASVRVGIAKDGWIAKSDAVHLDMVALDLANRPVRGQKITVQLFSRETYSYRKRLIGGFYAYDNSRETKALGSGCSGTTDARGRFKCTLDAGVSGEVIALATAVDAAGHVARATQSLWLAGDDDWWFGGDNGDRMDVVAEAPEYPAGGVARFQVRMPFREATALVSVLRDGVIDSFVTTLSGTEPIVAVRLARGYAPDVYVSVLAVRGRVAGWRLWLADLARAWHLPWLSRDAAAPTALVDLAKPSYRFGIAKIRVGWDDHRLGVRVATDSPTYAVRKVAATTVQVTPPRGRQLPAGTEIAFAAVDEALLQLQKNDSWDVLTAMMADRPVSVLTSTAQTQVVGKRHYGRKAVAAGGGGGEGAGGTVRRDFNPLLLWRGRVPVDAHGRATIPVAMNDSLSAFRLVAVATGGLDLFGTGSTVVRTTQDLQLLAGIPPLVREGDRYTATVLARNATGKAMRVSLGGSAGASPLPQRIVDIAAGNATSVAWDVAAPAVGGPIAWSIDARATSGATDAVRVAQVVAPAVPVETWQSTLLQLAPSQSFPVALPAGALPGRGGVDIALSRSLGGALPGVRAYMAAYPYDCIEQRLSVAVALGDRARWDAAAALLPAYLDRDGLVRFFPAEWIAGDDSLTAYLLRLSADSGWPLPAETRAKMVAGLTGFVAGHVTRSHDNVLVVEKGRGIVGTASFGGEGASRRLAAVAALMTAGAATPAMVEPLSVAPDAWPTATLVDWVTVLRLPGIPDAAGKLAQASNVLRARLDLQGTRLTITRADDPWQLLSSPDLTAARLLAAVAPLTAWQADVPRIARGLMLNQRRGHWDTTPANAVGTLAMRAFSARFEATPVAGSTTAALGTASHRFDWSAAPPSATLAWPPAPAPLTMTHAGNGAPWAIVTGRAAVPLTRAFGSGFAVRRAVTAVSQAVPGRWSRGDVMKVRVEVTARAPVAWVAINDPVPAGATILGGSLGGRSEILATAATAGVQPTFVERRTDAVHAHYESVTRAPIAYEYTLRLGSAGTFRLPPTRVEALYSPEMFAAVPNAAVVVDPRP